LSREQPAHLGRGRYQRLVFEGAEPTDRHDRAGLVVQIETRAHECSDALVQRGGDGFDLEQGLESLTESFECLQLQVVEAVEVPEHRSHRHPGALCDHVGAHRNLAVLEQREHRVDHREAPTLAPCATSVDRCGALPHRPPL
jgi:hypothetical protein